MTIKEALAELRKSEVKNRTLHVRVGDVMLPVSSIEGTEIKASTCNRDISIVYASEKDMLDRLNNAAINREVYSQKDNLIKRAIYDGMFRQMRWLIDRCNIRLVEKRGYVNTYSGRFLVSIYEKDDRRLKDAGKKAEGTGAGEA